MAKCGYYVAVPMFTGIRRVEMTLFRLLCSLHCSLLRVPLVLLGKLLHMLLALLGNLRRVLPVLPITFRKLRTPSLGVSLPVLHMHSVLRIRIRNASLMSPILFILFGLRSGLRAFFACLLP